MFRQTICFLEGFRSKKILRGAEFGYVLDILDKQKTCHYYLFTNTSNFLRDFSKPVVCFLQPKLYKDPYIVTLTLNAGRFALKTRFFESTVD